MLLPDEENNGFQRMRYTASYQNGKTWVKRTTLTGDWPNTYSEYPYVYGGAHITVDPKQTNWKLREWALSQKMEYYRNYDFGGSFVSNAIQYTPPRSEYYSKQEKIVGGPLLLHEQKGPVWPCYTMWSKFQDPISTRSMPVGMEWDQMWALGGSFISQTMPTVPELSLSVSLAEIFREGLPKKIGAELMKKISVKAAASEYLNIVFGYGPIYSDIKKLIEVLPRMEETLKQLSRDSGKLVRRGVRPRTSIVDSSYTHRSAPYASGKAYPGYNVLVDCRHTITNEVTTWFSAAYLYSFPSVDEISDRFKGIRQVLGLNVDPVTIWNLIPWSWLVDWFVPVSPVLQNLSVMARNQVRIQRAYTMCHSRYAETATNGKSQASLTMDTKQRAHASPWGFGLRTYNLTGPQLAILAALGLSRGNI